MKKKKHIERLIIVIVIIILLSIGYTIYTRYNSLKENNDINLNNYYTAEYLFNNDYIKVASLVPSNSIKEKDSTLYFGNYEIYNVPNDYDKIYYSKLDEGYEFAIIKDNDLYYVNTLLETGNSFQKISSNVSEIYILSYDDGYFIDKNIKSNFLISTKDKEIKYISYNNNLFNIDNNIEKEKPYFDYLKINDSLKIYITFDNHLVSSTNTKYKITNKDNDYLYVLDIFGEYDKSKNIYNIYVHDNDKNLYKLDITNKKNITSSLVSKSKVKEIEYLDNRIKITFLDSNIVELTGENGNTLLTSTVYDKNIK